MSKQTVRKGGEDKMSEIEFKIGARTILGIVLLCVGIALILLVVVQAIGGTNHITDLIRTQVIEDRIGENEAFIRVMAWFFALVIESVCGFFIGSFGIKIMKKKREVREILTHFSPTIKRFPCPFFHSIFLKLLLSIPLT